MKNRSAACVVGFYLVIGSLLIACKKEDSPVAETAKSPVNGDVRTDQRGMTQVWISPGSFLMGTSDSSAAELITHRPPSWVVNELPSEEPQHEVRLTVGYWIDKYEVTNDAFQAFTRDSGYYRLQYWSQNGKLWLATKSAANLPVTTGNEVSTHPRVNITWYEAEAYAAWRGGRLPTEAEWEFAARGPASLVYPWGNTFETLNANLIDKNSLTPVGSYPNGASWVGVHDLAGNAMEWVQDWLDVDYYKQKVRDDPQGPTTGSVKIEKGGWWGSNQFVGRSAYRHYEDPPTYGDQHIGFRIVTKGD